MPRTTKSKTYEVKGVRYRLCGNCGVEKILSETFFEVRSDLKTEGGFRQTCRTCNKEKQKKLRKNALKDPVQAEAIRSKERKKNAEYRQKRKGKVWIPKGQQLASCIRCCRDISRGFYVYAHEVLGYGIFYIGKGSGDRAWMTNPRHAVWQGFVANNIGRGVIVHILHQGLSEQEAYDFEVQEITDRGLRIDDEGKLMNLDRGGTGVSADVMKEVWKRRLNDPVELQRVQEAARKNLMSANARKKAIGTREQNEGYKESRRQRLANYAKTPELIKKAMATRAQNPTWLKNVQQVRREHFNDPINLEAHRAFMKTDAYRAAHAEGIKKHHKRTAMYFPAEWGHEGYHVVWESRTEMCRSMGFNKGKVTEVIKGTRSHHYRFKFADADG